MSRLLNEQQIQKAKELKCKGYSKRQIARYFGVGGTTIWDNIYYDPTKPRRHIERRIKVVKKPKVARFKSIVCVVQSKRAEGFTSGELSQMFGLPLEDINYIYANILK